jgi:hypothetical protein
VSKAPVEQNGLLDEPLPQYLSKEIDVVLGFARTHCDVVKSRTRKIYE